MSGFDLHRFVTAQAGTYATALAELRTGRKRSHWMWFVFPQLRGLGVSETARFYGIASWGEAEAYLAHTVLGPRLRACTEAVLGTSGRSHGAIFGSPDDLKFVSSMTLFAVVDADPDGLFDRALARFSGGVRDARTLALLDRPD